jgi:hypothetical protein
VSEIIRRGGVITPPARSPVEDTHGVSATDEVAVHIAPTVETPQQGHRPWRSTGAPVLDVVGSAAVGDTLEP